ncbi:MAG TPA: PAS domain-containing protein [Crinalium sp.]|jgi:PAS domain S-box-containing protein
MAHPLHHSTASGQDPSQDRPQAAPEAYDQTTVEGINYSDRQPDLALQILDSSDDCIKVLDLDGRILFMNRRGQALLGIQDITPFLKTSWIEFWSEEDRPAAMDAIARAGAGEVCSLQGYCPTLQGEPKWWDNKISPILGADGSVERLLCISRDITGRRQIEDKRKQAEAALRTSEEQFRLFIAASSDTVYKMSADWREMNLLTGKNFLTSTQHPNRTWLEEYIPVEEQARVMAAIAEAIRTKRTFELEHRIIQLDGTIGWTFSRAIPLLNDQNEIVEWLGAASDVTARKQAELSAEFLAQVTQNLAEATCVEDIIQTVGEQLSRYLQVSNCAFVEINESADEAIISHCWHRDDVTSLVGVHRLSEFVTGEFFQAAKIGHTVIVRDVTTDPRIANPERFTALNIGSLINVPLIRDDEWKFTLGVYHPTPYNWRSDEVELMRELANRIWTKLERTRVEIALRQNQEMFSALVADAPFGIYMIDAEFRFQQANHTAIATFNIHPLIGQDLAEALRTIWQEPFATEAIDRFRHTLATGESYYSPPIVEPRADIEEIQSYDWQIHRITLSDGRYGVVCYFYDLSDIKRAEEIVRRTGDRDAFLVTLNDALRPLTNAIEIQATANQVVGEYLGVNRVTYFEVRGAEYVVEQDYVNGAESLQGGYPIESFGTELLAVYRRGQTATSTNVATDPHLSPDQRSAYAGIQIAAYIGVPLVKQGEFVAGLAVHASRPRNWTLNEIALAEEVAERTWAAVERARAEAALRESEAKYRLLFDSIDEGFCLIEVLFDETGTAFDYRFLEANPALEKHTGLVDVIGKTMRELAPQHEAHWFEIYGRIALTGVPERFENVAQELGRFFDVYAFRMGEPQERKVAVLFNDISGRKQAEAAIAADLRDTQLLRELSARLTTETDIQVLYDEILAAAIALTQADAGSFQFFNHATQELLLLATQGISPTLGEQFNRLSTSCNTSCSVALATGERAFVDFDVPANEDPDGLMRRHVEAGLLSAQSTPLMSRSGNPIGMVSTHWRTRHRPSDRELRFLDLLARQAADLIEQRQDAAQRKQLLEREQAAREAAERANRIKDEFLAVLSHELRSPLNPILGWSKLLQSGKLDAAKTAQALATIERNAKLQSELIEDLLDVSRILRGKLSLNVTPVNLAATIRAAMETVRLAAEAKSIQITASLASDVGLVSGDSTRLQQVVWNLLSNAVKFTPPCGRVEVRLEAVSGTVLGDGGDGEGEGDSSSSLSSPPPPSSLYAQITVSDTGQGIMPGFLPYVFDYFRQADGATTRKFGGLGLGLAIVRHLVELHGGTVRVASPGEGQGATFTVRVPLMSTSSDANQDERSPQQSLNLSGIKILIVDDEPDTRELVAFILEQRGAQVTITTSAHEALLILPQAKPDILLSDIGMPEMDGYMLIRQVRMLAPEQGGRIPAIALTAYAGDTNQQQVLAAGFQTHISKPIEPEELVQAIVTTALKDSADNFLRTHQVYRL